MQSDFDDLVLVCGNQCLPQLRAEWWAHDIRGYHQHNLWLHESRSDPPRYPSQHFLSPLLCLGRRGDQQMEQSADVLHDVFHSPAFCGIPPHGFPAKRATVQMDEVGCILYDSAFRHLVIPSVDSDS